MPSLFHPRTLGVGLAATVGCLIFGGAQGADRPNSPATLPLKVRFWADEIELTGALPDQKTANRLMIAIHHAQPGKPIWDRLVIDPSRTVPDLPSTPQLAGLLLEMALSTKDSSLLVREHEVVVSGLTDSHVTHAAFEARLQSAAEADDRKAFRNRICLVHHEDLHPSLLPRRPRAVLAFRPVQSPSLEMAGTAYGPPLPPATLGSLTGRSASILGLNRETSPSGPSPLDASEPPSPTSESDSSEKLAKPILEPSRRIEFIANSYLVSTTDYDALDGIAARLKSHPAEWGKVIVRGFPDTAGRHTYNDWLSLSRARAVQRVLVEAGVSESLLKLEVSGGDQNPKNLRTVGIWIPRIEKSEENEAPEGSAEVVLSEPAGAQPPESSDDPLPPPAALGDAPGSSDSPPEL